MLQNFPLIRLYYSRRDNRWQDPVGACKSEFMNLKENNMDLQRFLEHRNQPAPEAAD